MGHFNLEDYEPVHERIKRFFAKYKDGRIVPELIKDEGTIVIFKATLFKDATEQEKLCPLSTGWAREVHGKGFVNTTSALENCETSAVGRALANIGLHGDKRASREEMGKVQKAETGEKYTETTNDKETKILIAKELKAMGCPKPKMGNWVIKTMVAGKYPLVGILSMVTDMGADGFLWDDTANELIKLAGV